MSRDEDLLPATVVGLASLPIVAPYTILVVANTFERPRKLRVVAEGGRNGDVEMWSVKKQENIYKPLGSVRSYLGPLDLATSSLLKVD